MAINIDEGEPGTFKDRYYLERDPHRFLEGMLIAAWAVGIDEIYIYLRDEYAGCRAILEREIAALQANPPCAIAAHPPAPRRRRLHLRRRVGDDRVDRGQARHAAAAPAVCRASRPLRPSHARAQHGNAALGARHRRERAGVVRRPRPQWPQRTALVLGLRPRQETRRASRAGRHHGAGADRRVLRRHARRPHVLRYLPGGASGGILPASMGDIPLDFDTLQPYGCFIGSAAIVILSDQDTRARRGAQPDEVFRRRIVRPMHAVPRRHGEGGRADGARSWDKPLLEELSQAMADASICGLGQAAPNPVAVVMKYFPQEIE